MQNTRRLIPIAGLVATMAVVGYVVVQLNGQAASTTGDFRNAAIAEVRDAQGQLILSGSFELVPEDDEDVERRATLAPTGSDTDAAGEAEVEFAKADPKDQEVEFSVRNVQPGATYTFVIDGTEVAKATADRSGKAEIELDVKIATATSSR
jgi:hypothetical protein